MYTVCGTGENTVSYFASHLEQMRQRVSNGAIGHLRAEHGVRLAAACLPVSKHRAIDAL